MWLVTAWAEDCVEEGVPVPVAQLVPLGPYIDDDIDAILLRTDDAFTAVRRHA